MIANDNKDDRPREIFRNGFFVKKPAPEGFVDHGHIVCPTCDPWWASGCSGYLSKTCWRTP